MQINLQIANSFLQIVFISVNLNCGGGDKKLSKICWSDPMTWNS